VQNIERIKMEDRVYSVQKLNPIEAILYGTKVASIIAPVLSSLSGDNGGSADKLFTALGMALKSPEIGEILRIAYNQCFTPSNESLKDEVVFNRQFMAFPGDAYELGVRAAYILVKDFFPRQIGTLVNLDNLKNLTLSK
jgi:hypothetical protein